MKKINKANYFLAIIIILLSYFFWKDFLYFQNEQIENTKIEILDNKAVLESQDFDISKIENLENTDLFYAPYEKLLDDFIDKINKAEKEIYFEVYMFTEKRILEALKKAKNRWVKIKILLEKSPYMSSNINISHFNDLKNAWIDVVWSNTKNYYLNHTKLFLIDDLAIISTWNLTYSTFTVNREFLVFTYDKNIFQTLKNIFEKDFSWEKVDFYHNNLVVSPNYSRIKLEKFFSWATKNIKIYAQYLKDDKINDLFIKLKKEKNVEIEMILDKKAKDDESVKKLQENWIKINFYSWKTMHSKAFLVDEKYLFIWSINFSNYSIDKNREIWILLKEENLIKKFLEVFEKDLGN